MNDRSLRSVLSCGFGVALLLSSGCSALEGKVSDGNYYAPDGTFVLPLDRGNVHVQDQKDELGGAVAVADDMGSNDGVTYVRLPSSAQEVLSDPAKRDNAYRGFVHDYALPSLFRPASAQSKIVNEEFLGSGSDRAFFAIAVIPGYSPAMDMKTGKRWDSVRALLVFEKSKVMYMLHSEINTVLDQVNAASLTDKNLESAHKKMQRMRASIRFQ